jgi:hypothetical protein
MEAALIRAWRRTMAIVEEQDEHEDISSRLGRFPVVSSGNRQEM